MKAVQYIGKLDKKIYCCISSDIVTDDVIITDERIHHIKERHPNDFERYCGYLKDMVENPQYILEANKPNSALIVGHYDDCGKNYKLILRLQTSTDPDGYKNSIISFQKVENKRYTRYLNSDKVLYRRE